MKTKKNSGMKAIIKLIMVLPVIVLFVIALISCGKSKNNETAMIEMAPPPPPPPPPPVSGVDKNEPLEAADVAPAFPGGDAALLKYLGNNIVYPNSAKLKGIQGKVIVKFAVEADGSVDKVSVVKGADPDLDNEAVRVVKTLEKFEPGLKDGKPVPVWYMVPINFRLN